MATVESDGRTIDAELITEPTLNGTHLEDTILASKAVSNDDIHSDEEDATVEDHLEGDIKPETAIGVTERADPASPKTSVEKVADDIPVHILDKDETNDVVPLVKKELDIATPGAEEQPVSEQSSETAAPEHLTKPAEDLVAFVEPSASEEPASELTHATIPINTSSTTEETATTTEVTEDPETRTAQDVDSHSTASADDTAVTKVAGKPENVEEEVEELPKEASVQEQAQAEDGVKEEAIVAEDVPQDAEHEESSAPVVQAAVVEEPTETPAPETAPVVEVEAVDNNVVVDLDAVPEEGSHLVILSKAADEICYGSDPDDSQMVSTGITTPDVVTQVKASLEEPDVDEATLKEVEKVEDPAEPELKEPVDMVVAETIPEVTKASTEPDTKHEAEKETIAETVVETVPAVAEVVPETHEVNEEEEPVLPEPEIEAAKAETDEVPLVPAEQSLAEETPALAPQEAAAEVKSEASEIAADSTAEIDTPAEPELPATEVSIVPIEAVPEVIPALEEVVSAEAPALAVESESVVVEADKDVPAAFENIATPVEAPIEETSATEEVTPATEEAASAHEVSALAEGVVVPTEEVQSEDAIVEELESGVVAVHVEEPSTATVDSQESATVVEEEVTPVDVLEVKEEPSVNEDIVNVADEAPEIAFTPAEGDLTPVEVEGVSVESVEKAEIEQPEHPKSPWTPSYSVTTQGPGSKQDDDVEELNLPPATVAAAAAVPTIATEEAPITEETKEEPKEEAKQSWPVSYTVSSQGNSPLLQASEAVEDAPPVESGPVTVIKVEAEAEEKVEAGEEVPPVEEIVPKAEDDEPVAVPEIEIEVEAEAELPVQVEESVDSLETPVIVTPDEPTVANEEPSTMSVEEQKVEESHPERPWTPSYSVSRQGSSPFLAPQEPKEVEATPTEDIPVIAEPEAVFEEPATTPQEKAEETEVPERPTTPSYAITTQGSTSSVDPQGPADETMSTQDIPAISEPEGEKPTAELALNDEKVEESQVWPQSRPWTPSYSVSRQGSTTSLVSPHEPADEATLVQDVSVITELEAQPEEKALIEEPVQDTVEEKAEDIKEVPERPWTPSYSVSRQGSSSFLAPTEPEDEATLKTEDIPAIAEPEATADVLAVAEPTEEAQEEAPTPAERPWTPSYSVSRQGSSPPQQAVDFPAADAPALVIDEAVTEEPTKEEAPTQESAPERPWTPSYSVSQQGVSPLQTPVDFPAADAPALVVVDDSEASELTRKEATPERPWTPSYSISRQGTSPVHTPKIEAVQLPEPIAEEKAPERPWTPSYSVSKQGSSTLLAAEELKDEAKDEESKGTQTPIISIEGEVASIAAEEPAVETEEKPASPSWTPSYSVSRQGSPAGTPQVKAAELPDDPALAVTDKAEDTTSAEGHKNEGLGGSWASSYSVTTQGSPSPAKEPVGDQFQAFPTTEIAETLPRVANKPSLARLATLTEDEPTNTTSPPTIEGTTTSPTRSRIESTTSSRYFPGGWFSSNPKSPEENRASLDHAAGEFTKVKTDGEAVEDAGEAEAEAPVNTPVESVEEPRHRRHKKRGKWCVIM